MAEVKNTAEVKLPPETSTIVWDLDGTLLDSFSIYEDIVGQLFSAKGLPMPARELMLNNFHGTIQEALKALVEMDDEEFAGLLSEFWAIDDEYIKEVNEHLFPDALDLARKAHVRGIRQHIVTNRPHAGRPGNGSPRGIVQNSPLRHLIDQVMCGDEVEHRKPNARVMQGIDYDPSTTVVIGDQAVDAQLALNIGATAVLVARQGDIPHVADLSKGWENRVTIVDSLSQTSIA